MPESPLHHNTPLIRSEPLSHLTGANIYLKMDALQPVGSFKIRGVGYACQVYAQKGAKRFISSSGGNAGIAAAYAGCTLGTPVLVFVPQTTTPRAIAQIEQFGATVTVSGASWQEANSAALAECTDQDAFLHPFDDPLLWQGHASLVHEIAASGLTPEVVVTAVGGGGLLSGIGVGLAECGWQSTTLVCAETLGAASFAAAFAANQVVELERIDSIATSLGARAVCKQALTTGGMFNTRSLVVTDAEAIAACRRFLSDHRVLVEPACGAALAVLYDGKMALASNTDVVVEICGGSTVDLADLQTLPGWG